MVLIVRHGTLSCSCLCEWRASCPCPGPFTNPGNAGWQSGRSSSRYGLKRSQISQPCPHHGTARQTKLTRPRTTGELEMSGSNKSMRRSRYLSGMCEPTSTCFSATDARSFRATAPSRYPWTRSEIGSAGQTARLSLGWETSHTSGQRPTRSTTRRAYSRGPARRQEAKP